MLVSPRKALLCNLRLFLTDADIPEILCRIRLNDSDLGDLCADSSRRFASGMIHSIKVTV